MDFTSIGYINNYLKSQKMEKLWQLRSKNPMSSGIAGDPAGVSRPGISQGDPKISAIVSKLQAGEELSFEELEYLRKNAPSLYREAMAAIKEKKEYEVSLRRCRTKTEVRALQMGKVAAAMTAFKNGEAAGDSAACMSAGAKLKLLTKAYINYTTTKDFKNKAENEAELREAKDALDLERAKSTREKERPEKKRAEDKRAEQEPVGERFGKAENIGKPGKSAEDRRKPEGAARRDGWKGDSSLKGRAESRPVLKSGGTTANPIDPEAARMAEAAKPDQSGGRGRRSAGSKGKKVNARA